VIRSFDKTDYAISAVVLFTALLAYLAYVQSSHAPFRSLTATDIFVLLAMLLLVVLLDFAQVRVQRLKFRAAFVVSGTVFVAATIGYGVLVGILLAVVGSFISESVARREKRKFIFNVAQFTCATAAAGLLYHAIAGDDTRVPLATTKTAIAALLAALLYMIVNNGLFAFVVGTSIGKSPVAVFIANAPGMLLQNITLPSIGLLLTTVRDLSPLSLLIALLPLLGPYLAMRGYRDNLTQMGLMIEALADAVDHRDPLTARHSERVAQYTQQAIEELGHIKFADAETIVAAARVHDVGKVGIPDAILLKPGRLTEQEFAVIRTHPVEGFKIIGKLPMYKDGAGIVRHHHERYDGAGYPDSLSGEAIPLGARIIAVADAYDVMTSDRPYAHARSQREACEELMRCRGTHFDPVVVDAFVTMINRPAVLEDRGLVQASATTS